MKAYACKTSEKELLLSSSSGGAFTELARIVLSQGGVVFGAGWETGTFRVIHKAVQDEAALEELRGSKYVASDITRVYAPLREYIQQGRMVLFTGTPCQIAAVRKFVGAADNLFLIALICHSTPDPKYWAQYIKEIEEQNQSRVRSVRFKDKSRGWRNASMVIKFEDRAKEINTRLYDNPYASACFNGYTTRECCLNCPFRSNRAGADIVIGDFWGVESVAPELDDDLGTSVAIVYSQKGEDLLSRSGLRLQEVRYEQVLTGNPMLEASSRPDMRRRLLFQKAYIEGGFHYAYQQVTRKTLRELLQTLIRRGKRLLLIKMRGTHD